MSAQPTLGHYSVIYPLSYLSMVILGSRVVQWSKSLHLSARGVITDTLVQIQAVSQPDVIGSPIGVAHNWPSSVWVWLV